MVFIRPRKLIVHQEGGYNVAYVGFCAYASVLVFLGVDIDLDDSLTFYPVSDLLTGQKAVKDNSEDTVSRFIDPQPIKTAFLLKSNSPVTNFVL